MTSFEIQLIKRYAEKNDTTWDKMIKDFCESMLVHAINEARAEITKDLTVEDICLKLEQASSNVDPL